MWCRSVFVGRFSCRNEARPLLLPVARLSPVGCCLLVRDHAHSPAACASVCRAPPAPCLALLRLLQLWHARTMSGSVHSATRDTAATVSTPTASGETRSQAATVATPVLGCTAALHMALTRLQRVHTCSFVVALQLAAVCVDPSVGRAAHQQCVHCILHWCGHQHQCWYQGFQGTHWRLDTGTLGSEVAVRCGKRHRQ